MNNNYIEANLRISTNSDILERVTKSKSHIVDEDQVFKVPIAREIRPLMGNKSSVEGHHIQLSDSSHNVRSIVKDLSDSFSSMKIDQ